MKTKHVTAVAGPVKGPWALPNGWRWALLGDISATVGGGRLKLNKSDYVEAGFPAFSAAGQDGFVGRWEFENEAVVLSSIGARCGKSFFARGRWTSLANTQCIFPSNDVDARYLWYFTNNEKRWERSGSAQPFIKPATIRELLIPLPSIGDQRRIVARIDELFAEIDDGEAALARARTDLTIWRKSLLKAAVTGELTADWRAANPPTETGADLLTRILDTRRTRWEAQSGGKLYKKPTLPDITRLPSLPNGWFWASLDQLVDKLCNGISTQPAPTPPGVPILRISSVRALKVRDSEVRWLPQNFQVNGALARTGDLLFTRYNGNPDLVGVCGRYRAAKAISYPDKIMCASICSDSDAVGDYIELAMNAGVSRKHIESSTKTSAGQHGVSGSSVKITPVPLPPAGEIERIIKIYRDATGQADEGWSDAEGLITVSSTLRHSILAAAFRGQLA